VRRVLAPVATTKEPVIAVTGHRPDKLPGGYNLKDPKNLEIQYRIELALKRLKPSVGITGMALGIDQMFALVCIKLKIPFIAMVPFKGQEAIWAVESKKLYEKILSQAMKVEYVSEPPYAAWKMQVRNVALVDACDIVLAVFDGSEGGTKNCINYAEKQKKQIEYIKLKDKNGTI
jgi:uncharacterized phage-like protein YoqJ